MRLRLLVLPLLAACQKSPPGEAAPAASSSAPVVAPAAPEKPAARAWYEGAWHGEFRAELFRVELPVGGVKEWKQDDGKQASGPGSLKLQIAADGGVNGTASGALGELAAVGRAEGDRVAFSLRPVGSDGFHGYVLVSQTPEGMRGTLSASSGDSLQVRKADVTLSRAAP